MDPIKNWNSEKQSAFLYRVLSRHETNPERKHLFERLGEEAENQAAIWEGKFTPGLSPTHFKIPLRVHAASFLIGVMGPRALRGILSAMKVRGMSVYLPKITSHAMPNEVSQVGSRHHGLGAGSWLRASVFGVNDGLVSNASLVLGAAGASLDHRTILLTGVAGMVGGAFSMACGEYISVKSQREFFEKQIALEKEELELYPEEEAMELALIFEARGLSKSDAERTGKALIANPARALETLAREELGVNPEDLGSAPLAAGSSFASFVLGAFVPILPFLFRFNESPLVLSVGLTALSLLGIGATVSLFTGRSAFGGALRMLLIGAFSGGCTFALGYALNVGIN
jgi:vacuolar iron transporter family protein